MTEGHAMGDPFTKPLQNLRSKYLHQWLYADPWHDVKHAIFLKHSICSYYMDMRMEPVWIIAECLDSGHGSGN